MRKTAVIGCGYWGPNYIRICGELKNCELVYCCDLQDKNLDKVKPLCGNRVKFVKDFRVIADDPEIEAVIIATSLPSHYMIAKYFLERKKNLLIEKPFTSTSVEAEELLEIAKKNNCIALVGHVYEHNPAVNYIKEQVKNNMFGKLFYVHAERIGLGPIRKHANALWDLAPHDISIALYLMDEFPESVMAVGGAHVQQDVNDMILMSMNFSAGFVYNIYVNWISPVKIRRTTFAGEKQMAVMDDVNKEEAVKLFKHKFNFTKLNSTPRYTDHQHIIDAGDMEIVKIPETEPLKTQVVHFLDMIDNDYDRVLDKRNIGVLKLLEAAEESIKMGKTICL